MLLEPVGDGLDDRAGEEHPCLRGVDPDVAGTASSCARTNHGGTSSTASTSTGVLRGERDDRRRSMDAGGGERLEVGLDPGAAAGVGARDRDAAWNQRTPFAGMTRIRFDGCDLSRARGTPVAKP